MRLYVVPADGSREPSPITATDASVQPGVAWSPDGQWIAFVRTGVGFRRKPSH